MDANAILHMTPALVGMVAVGTTGWVITMWMRMRHGYPIENSWGRPMLPHGGGETIERVKLLAQENAQLRAEMGSLKDRMQVLERIAVDASNSGSRLAAEIDGLATKQIN